MSTEAFGVVNELRRAFCNENLSKFNIEADSDVEANKTYKLQTAGLSEKVIVGYSFSGNTSKQMKQAASYGANLVVLIGEDELKAGCVTVKDMAGHKQETIPRSSLVGFLNGSLNTWVCQLAVATWASTRKNWAPTGKGADRASL